jgi:hypothetical protein
MDDEKHQPLEPYLVKQLLTDIETSGYTRDKASFLYICNNSPQIYGQPASDLRRRFQRTFQRLKKKPLNQYVAFAKSLGVLPSPETLLEQTPSTSAISPRQESKEDSEDSPEDAKDSSNSPEDAEDSSNMFGNDNEEDDLAASSFEELSMATPPRPLRSAGRPPTPPPSGGTKRTPASHISLSSILSPLGTMIGTKEHPYVIQVDLAHPERHQEFCIERVTKLKDGEHIRTGMQIRRAVPVCDFDRWEATIPRGYPRDLDYRLVLVEGPSQNYWLRDSTRFHSDLKCNATEQAHQATEIEIADDINRQSLYWLLVFPKDIVLDNQVYSSDSFNVEPDWNQLTSGEKDNPVEKKLYGMVMMWKIAEIGGRRIAMAKRKPDPKKLFSKK